MLYANFADLTFFCQRTVLARIKNTFVRLHNFPITHTYVFIKNITLFPNRDCNLVTKPI